MSIYDSSEVLSGVCCLDPQYLPQAQLLAQQLNLSLLSLPAKQLDEGAFVLVVDEQGVALQATGKKVAGPIRVDFVHGSNAHRRQFGGGKGQMIAKAVGIKGAYRPNVLDVTAGLGQDAFVLATLGCHVTLVERSAVVYTLLREGLDRAAHSGDSDLNRIVSRIQSVHQHSVIYLEQLASAVDVIYLDPMFPERNSKAEVKKNMKAFHRIVGEDLDAGELLKAALAKAIYRVVVKRPRKSPTIGEQFPDALLPSPSLVLEGKSTRFDIYTLKKMP